MNLDEMKQNFNGGYIIPSQEALDLLRASGVDCSKIAGDRYIEFIAIDNNIARVNNSPRTYKQIKIKHGALSWDEPIQLSAMNDLNDLPIGEEDVIRDITLHDSLNTNVSDSLSNMVSEHTISITDEDGKVYEFEKPSFECELLKVIFPNTKNIEIVGIVNKDTVVTWLVKYGECYGIQEEALDTYNLTPIQKKWYENEDIKRAVLINENGKIKVFSKGHNFKKLLKDGWRLATKQELNSLYYEGKES